MTGPYFVDTNVLVYVRDASEPRKQPIAQAWVEYLWKTRQGRISMQVLQEYYQVVTRRLRPGLPRERARSDIRDLLAWKPIAIDAAVIERAWTVEERLQLSWWDALIIGAAQQSGCQFLLTEDLQTGQGLAGVTAISPFETAIPR